MVVFPERPDNLPDTPDSHSHPELAALEDLDGAAYYAPVVERLKVHGFSHSDCLHALDAVMTRQKELRVFCGTRSILTYDRYRYRSIEAAWNIWM